MPDPTVGADEAVTRFLRGAPALVMPPAVSARLHETIAGEVQLRRAGGVEPDAELTELKSESLLWSDDTVEDL